nr:MAG TPA: hypothetical protein [Caudoviricetes sp.]
MIVFIGYIPNQPTLHQPKTELKDLIYIYNWKHS